MRRILLLILGMSVSCMHASIIPFDNNFSLFLYKNCFERDIAIFPTESISENRGVHEQSKVNYRQIISVIPLHDSNEVQVRVRDFVDENGKKHL